MNKYLSVTSRGLEHLLHDEILMLGGVNIKIVSAGVIFEADLNQIYDMCMSSRFCSRFIMILSEDKITSENELYEKIYKIEWEKIFKKEMTFVVDFKGTNGFIRNSYFGALRVKDAISDRFIDTSGSRGIVDKLDPDLRVYTRLVKNTCLVGIDMCGFPLHQRGYRSISGDAPLRETHAAALVTKSNWETNDYLLDPMCGSGTILIEAALMKLNSPPNLNKHIWGFKSLINFDAHIYEEVRTRLLDSIKNRDDEVSVKIFGSDLSSKMIDIAKRNAKKAGVLDLIHFEVRDIANLESIQDFSNGFIISNPPYGKRLGNPIGLIDLYTNLGRQLKDKYCGSQAFIYSSNSELLNYMGMRAFKSFNLMNGKLNCVLKSYQIGSKSKQQEAVISNVKLSGNIQNTRAEENKIHELNIAPDFKNRLVKNIKKFNKWSNKEKIYAYRIYDADLPDYNVAIDKYNDFFVIQEYAAPKNIDINKSQRRLMDVVKVVLEVTDTSVDKVVIKKREKQSGFQQYNKLDNKQNFITIKENGLSFIVNLFDYLDTGLFLDHRLTREMIRGLSKNKDVLNLFAYTGSVSVYAADGQAKSVTTVDMSNTYLNWAQKNMALNNFRGNMYKYIHADCLAWLYDNDDKFDLIFVDPPTFSNSKKMDDSFEIQKDHLNLMTMVKKHLNIKGKVIFTNNKRSFHIDRNGIEGLGFELKELTHKTISEDFKRNAKIHNSWLLELKEV